MRHVQQRGAIMAYMMSAIAASGALLFFLSHSIFLERRNVRRSEQSEAAYYAAEAGIEATLADISSGRTPKGWRGDNVQARVEVTRKSDIISIQSTGIARDKKVTITVRATRRGGQLNILSWQRGHADLIPAR